MSFAIFIRSPTGEMLGPFEFQSVPRVNDDVAVPSLVDASGVRCFHVDEMTHYARGVGAEGHEFDEAYTLLEGDEIT